MHSVYNFTLSELSEVIINQGLPRYIARQVFDWIYKKRVCDFDQMGNISQKARSFLKKTFNFSRFTLIKKQISSDGTEKYLFELLDKALLETVFIPEKERATLCLSSQVGCKFRCSFCSSGALGFKRNLETGEIIAQYLWAVDQGKVPTNIVFMGIGEPLDNFDNVVKAIRILTDTQGIGFSKRKICISTAGFTPVIKKLLELDLGIKLSISLHSADETVRSQLMPINRQYPLKELIATLKNYRQKAHYPFTFEYALMAAVNTRQKDVALLSRLLHGLRYKINLIPLNEAQGPYKLPAQKEIEEFTAALKKKGVIFTLRKSRGQDIAAACGQLRSTMSENR